ncbi:hypothetical protein EDD22DRAFT_850358 [Suillus occidentalis]|nr:hypothetical protein EDD22DRAFT_850358 [Suillus occidentalis]
MSAPVQSSLAGLQASTAQLAGIITQARLTPAGTGEAHHALTAQATTLVGTIARQFEKGPYMPGVVASCSRELMRVRSMTPRVWPNWHSIGHDDPRISKHSWHSKIQAWDALGDHSCDLPVVPNPSTAPLTVDLPSPLPIPSAPVHPSVPVIPSAPVPQFPPGLAGPSTLASSGFWDKGKGKAVDMSLEPDVGGSRKRKSPLISGDSSQPPKSAMKSHKRPKSTRIVKSKLIVESEDDEDTIIQPISRGVPEVVLPRISTLAQGTPHSPHSPCSPKKKSFGSASLTAGSRLEVPESPSTRPEVAATSGTCLEAREDHDTESMLRMAIPQSLVHSTLPFLAQTTPAIIVSSSIGPAPLGLTGGGIPPVSPASAAPARSTPAPTAPAASQSRARTRSQSRGPTRTPAVPAVTTPQVQSRGRSKTMTSTKAPAPAPAPTTAPVLSSSVAVPRSALDVPMPDLHGNRHPGCSTPPSMSPLPSALPALINLDMADMAVMEPTPLKVEDGSDMIGLMFEPSQVQPEGPQTSGEIVVPDDLGNLVPEYNSASEEMDIEVPVEPADGEVDMAT